MFLHQQSAADPHAPLCHWWVVELETLTLARCTTNLRSHLSIEIVGPDTTPDAVSSHPFTFLPGPFASRLLTECRLEGNKHRKLTATHIIPSGAADMPEWLLLASTGGETPAIMHTTDPVFVTLADPETAVLKSPEFFRSNVDLPAEGWAYWWEDAQRNFEKLWLECCDSLGIPVPQDIRDMI